MIATGNGFSFSSAFEVNGTAIKMGQFISSLVLFVAESFLIRERYELKDLYTAVEYLQITFRVNKLRASFKALVGEGDRKEIDEYFQRYDNGDDICTKYLEARLNIDDFIIELYNSDLGPNIKKVQEFVPEHLHRWIVPKNKEGEEEEEEEDEENLNILVVKLKNLHLEDKEIKN
jgi:hypothetical protein